MDITLFISENPSFKEISRVFSLEIPHLSDNPVFSLLKSPI
ncbi:hypothetical protein CP061683_2133 [Chlamydia psittaci 06-1683]|nr:hypothetical protein CP061683_2133 [Chlamydia psittaci 06-1683]